MTEQKGDYAVTTPTRTDLIVRTFDRLEEAVRAMRLIEDLNVGYRLERRPQGMTRHTGDTSYDTLNTQWILTIDDARNDDQPKRLRIASNGD